MKEETVQETQNVSPEELLAAYNELRENYDALVAQRNTYGEMLNRLQFALKVVENSKLFPKAYLNGIIADIMKLLPVDGIDIEKELKKMNKKAEKAE